MKAIILIVALFSVSNAFSGFETNGGNGDICNKEQTTRRGNGIFGFNTRPNKSKLKTLIRGVESSSKNSEVGISGKISIKDLNDLDRNEIATIFHCNDTQL